MTEMYIGQDKNVFSWAYWVEIKNDSELKEALKFLRDWKKFFIRTLKRNRVVKNIKYQSQKWYRRKSDYAGNTIGLRINFTGKKVYHD